MRDPCLPIFGIGVRSLKDLTATFGCEPRIQGGLPQRGESAVPAIERAFLYAGVFFSPFIYFRIDSAFFTLSDAFYCCALILGLLRSGVVNRPFGTFTF